MTRRRGPEQGWRAVSARRGVCGLDRGGQIGDKCKTCRLAKRFSIGPFMPSLLRFLIVLLFLAGLVFGAMVALPIFVQPNEKDVIVRIPARDLFGED